MSPGGKWWARGSGFFCKNFSPFHPLLPPEKAIFLFCLACPPSRWLPFEHSGTKTDSLDIDLCTEHCVPVSHLHVPHQNSTSTFSVQRSRCRHDRRNYLQQALYAAELADTERNGTADRNGQDLDCLLSLLLRMIWTALSRYC